MRKKKVMIATTGARLLPPEALDVLHTRLLPLATIVTPNVPEALLLLKGSGAQPDIHPGLDAVRTVDDLETLARAIRRFGPKWVLVKGGHCPFRRDRVVAEAEAERELVVDVLVGEDGETGREVVVRLETGYCASRHTHGTGCSLACEFCPFSFSLGTGELS
jgi:hydroxymethylpyrimidine/phosphomethylpyrimidine kinase